LSSVDKNGEGARNFAALLCSEFNLLTSKQAN
jgi:hypothetical protein